MTVLLHGCIFFFFLKSGSCLAGKKIDPDPTLIRNKNRIFIFKVDRHKIRFYKPSLKFEFVDSGLHFVTLQDENNFIYPLFQVGSGYDEKSKLSIWIRQAKNQRIRPDLDNSCNHSISYLTEL